MPKEFEPVTSEVVTFTLPLISPIIGSFVMYLTVPPSAPDPYKVP